MAEKFGEDGRRYFHAVSSIGTDYNERKCDIQYDRCIKNGRDGISIGTFYFYCREAGLDIQTEATRLTTKIYTQRVKSGMDRKEAGASTREYMKKMQNVEVEKTQPLIEQLEQIPTHDLKADKESNKVEGLELFMKSLDLKKNEITKGLEYNGKPITNTDINSVYIKALKSVDDKLQPHLVKSFMNSELIPSYNPFTAFFEKNKHLRPEGNIKELCECFEYRKSDSELTSLSMIFETTR